jgi:hypothetical protein
VVRTIAGLLGSLVYLTSCVVCVVFVSVPLILLTAAVGLAGGVLLVVVLAGVVLFGVGGTEIRTPRDVAAGKLPGRVRAAYVRRDRAWPQYFAAQVLLDLRSVAHRTRAAVRVLWRVPPVWLREQELTVWWPLYVPVVAAQLTSSAGAALGVVIATLVVGAVGVGAWTVGVPAVYLLRAADAGWRRAIRARAGCPRCFELTAVPAYRCLGPHPTQDRLSGDDLHRDVRPGRLGVLWRRCACGRRLPTTVLRAALSHRLQACCPTCGEPMHRGAAAVTDVRVPVLGAASAGKTQLVVSAIVTLHRVAADRGVRVRFPDEHSQEVYRDYARLAREGLPTAKTGATGPPVALSVELATRTRRALLHIFDAAGEILIDREQNAQLSYLDYARSLIFVLDPFSLPQLRDEFESSFPDVFKEANPASHDPEESYRAPVSRLQEYGVRTNRQDLAFVVSKADLLDKLSAAPADTSSAGVAGWLSDHGLGNLVVATGRDFRQVRFFLTAGRSLDVTGAFAPLNWLLEKEWTGLA